MRKRSHRAALHACQCRGGVAPSASFLLAPLQRGAVSRRLTEGFIQQSSGTVALPDLLVSPVTYRQGTRGTGGPFFAACLTEQNLHSTALPAPRGQHSRRAHGNDPPIAIPVPARRKAVPPWRLPSASHSIECSVPACRRTRGSAIGQQRLFDPLGPAMEVRVLFDPKEMPRIHVVGAPLRRPPVPLGSPSKGSCQPKAD